MEPNQFNQPLLHTHSPDGHQHVPHHDQQQHYYGPENPPENPYQQHSPIIPEQQIRYPADQALYYQEPQVMVTHHVITSPTHIVYDLPALPMHPQGKHPEPFYCTMCNKQTVSDIHHEMGTCSWICSIGLFIAVCPLGLLPCCCSECQDAVHTCPQCRREVGRHRFCGC